MRRNARSLARAAILSVLLTATAGAQMPPPVPPNLTPQEYVLLCRFDSGWRRYLEMGQLLRFGEALPDRPNKPWYPHPPEDFQLRVTLDAPLRLLPSGVELPAGTVAVFQDGFSMSSSIRKERGAQDYFLHVFVDGTRFGLIDPATAPASDAVYRRRIEAWLPARVTGWAKSVFKGTRLESMTQGPGMPAVPVDTCPGFP